MRKPFVLFIGLYAIIAVIAAVAYFILPAPLQLAIDSLTGGAGLGVFDGGGIFARTGPAAPRATAPMWAVGTIAMTSGGLLSLPVAWLYTITRQKRGYNQSVVQSLILLPVVVAGVVVLVKFSLALAFSLAGIVAAVRFRNTLEDSKDAVYIFVVTGIGLASGVELTAAMALSVIFNAVTLLLFASDFGRSPARLEGEMAEERMQRALQMANRRSQFVNRLDEEILEDMAPEQLAALADRAWQRRREAGFGAGGGSGKMNGSLRVRTRDVAAAREFVEGKLAERAKRWVFERVERTPAGEDVLVYAIRLRKSVAPTALIDALRADAGSVVIDAQLQ